MKTTTLPSQITEIPKVISKLQNSTYRPWLGRGGVVVLIIFAIIFLNGMLAGQKKEAIQNPHTPVLTVTTKPAAMKVVDHVIGVHGSISAWDAVSVAATTGGSQVKTILVEEGLLVKKGQLLAVLDCDQLQAQIESEKARLAASVANVSKSIQPNRPEDINGLMAAVSQAQANVGDQEAGLIQAQANLDNARSNLKRYQYLRSEGAVSEQEAETRTTTVQVTEAAVNAAQKRVKAAEFVLRQAQERLSMAKIGGRKEDIQIARANVAEIKGNIKRLQKQIDETLIKAPIDGLITRRDVHLGDITAAGKTMFFMARDNRLELKAEVPETDLSFIKPGQKVMIQSAYSGKDRIEGIVREISPLVDTTTRLALVRIDVPSNCGLKQGMYAEGHIKVNRYMALTVPAQAVISRDEKNTVFVLHNDQVESRPIVVGNRDNSSVQVSAGLHNNEQVVVDGAGFLKDGDYVAIAH